MKAAQKHPNVIFNKQQREIVQQAIIEVCIFRGYALYALNVRTNHSHVVTYARANPDKISGDFKAYATRALRANGFFVQGEAIWTRGGSTRYLWKGRHVNAAIDYVKYCQEDIPFEFKEEKE